MKSDVNLIKAQKTAGQAARAAGALMRNNLRAVKRASSVTQHDIKLELDVRCQKLIERKLLATFPQVAVLGEEGDSGKADAQYRWVVDPIDGTVNFAYGIPHACVSIALQTRSAERGARNVFRKGAAGHAPRIAHHVTLLGVVYDPFQDELWTAIRGQPARLNGRPIRVSKRSRLGEAVISIGFTKSPDDIEKTLPYFGWLVRRVRKLRMMGAAALGLVYVATGRFDAYLERGVSLWDIAAGGLIVECAGGEFWHRTVEGKLKYRMVANNGLLRRKLKAGNLLK